MRMSVGVLWKLSVHITDLFVPLEEPLAIERRQCALLRNAILIAIPVSRDLRRDKTQQSECAKQQSRDIECPKGIF